MEILYIAFKDFSKLHYGASKKVISECRAFESFGHNVTLVGREKNATVTVSTSGDIRYLRKHSVFPIGKCQTLVDKECQIRDILSYISGRKYDYCYIRYDLCTGSFIRLLKGIRRICPVIHIELPTYPYDREYAGRINKVRLAIDDFYARNMKRYVSRIISFYAIPDNCFYGIPVRCVPNGFDFDGISVIQSNEIPTDIHIAAVSSMRLWHGYERMIEGLHNYYENGGSRNIVMHIVGDGREGKKYRDLTQTYELEEHVMFHGAMHGKALDDLLEMCTVGLDSLGRHRTGISMLSSLKSREYGAIGLPIINSCDLDILDSDFPYFLKVPADESPINVEEVIQFHDNCYKSGNRAAVAREIRDYIESKSNMKAVMSLVLEGVKD